MTDFGIFALAMPIVGTVFVVGFVLFLTRFDRRGPEHEQTEAPRAGLKEAAE
jgi:hypothetical protein